MNSKSGKRRRLTPFLCQEMLYDYAIGRLDGERKIAVEQFLKDDNETRKLHEGILAALAYTENLAKIEIREEAMVSLLEVETPMTIGRKYSSWKAWPESLRWTIVTLTISCMVAGTVALIPWHRFAFMRPEKNRDVIELAELSRPTEQQLEAALDTNENQDETSDGGSGDEEWDDGATEVPSPKVDPAKIAKTNPLVLARPNPVVPPPGKPTQLPAVAIEEPQPKKKVDVSATARGFVYRAFMNLANLELVENKLTESIAELGGIKAGEVELGWKRGTGRYYHFSLPAENEEKLLERLRAFGPVRMSKDPHPRIMPEGQVRFILWVEPL